MKYLLFAALSAISIGSFAQDSTAVQKAAPLPATAAVIIPPAATMTMTTDAQGTVIVIIPEAISKDVQKDWVKYAGKSSKGKATIVDGEYLQSAAVDKNISADPFDLSATMLASSDGVRLSVHIVQNTAKTLTTVETADRSIALQKYVHDFAVMEYRDIVQEQLKAAQGKQKDMEKELARLYKDEEKANKHISDDQRSIQKATDDIAANKLTIQDLNGKIETQKGMITSTASDPKASKGANKTMEDLESSRKELQKKNNKLSKDIDSWNKDINQEQRAIVGFKEKQAAQSVNIAAQKATVEGIQSKLASIK